MKSLPRPEKDLRSLLAALFLGAVALVLNWFYLHQRAAGTVVVHLLGIRDGVQVAPGTLFEENHFTAVPVPERYARHLKQYAYLYDDLGTIVGVRATKPYSGGELMLRQDYRTPPARLQLAADERLIWVPVDTRSFVPALVNPGDLVTFLVPREPQHVVTAGGANELDGNAGLEAVGPFRLGSLGNRLGTVEVMEAHQLAQVQDRQVGVVVRAVGTSLEPRALRLLDALRKAGPEGVQIALHPRQEGGAL